MRNKIYFITLISCVLLLYNCNKSPTESETKDLINILWTLESFDVEGNIIKPPKDQLYTIQFKVDSTFSGKSDCNEIIGNYIIEPNQFLNITKLGTSFANCGEESMYWEYYNAIDHAYSYEINKNKLHIYYSYNSRLNFIGE